MDGVRVGEVGDEGDGALEEEATAVRKVVVEGGGEAVPDAVACRSERRGSLTHSLLLHEAAHLLDAATLLVGGGLGPVQQGVPVQLPITDSTSSSHCRRVLPLRQLTKRLTEGRRWNDW